MKQLYQNGYLKKSINRLKIKLKFYNPKALKQTTRESTENIPKF